MLVTGSIVVYKNSFEDIKNAMNSFLQTNLNVKLYISDNSPDERIKEICKDSRVEYIFNNSNNGFGYAHNIAIKRAEQEGSKYHLVINPDTYFDKGNLEKMISYMQENKDIGLMMPKILYPNGDIQYVCKLLPTPFNMFARGFLPEWKWVKKINDLYEMRFTEYNKIMDVPYISGCFMVFRSKMFEEVGYFDENIFMYLEETDFTRRIIRAGYRTVMYPTAQVYHKWEKGTHNNKRLRNITIKSAIYYFNKYGWFFDNERRRINQICKKNSKLRG